MMNFIKKPWVMVTIAVLAAAYLEAKYKLFSGAAATVKESIPLTAANAPVVK